MSYIQGFLIPVPKANKEAYQKMAEDTGPIFMEYGALRIVESWSDNIEDGKVTDFKMAVKAKDGEAVVFSWIEWPDQATYEAAGEKMQNDPRWEGFPDMPFDGMRMMWGGFDPIFEVKA